MNLTEPEWIGQMRVTGIAKPIESDGSFNQIVREFMLQLTSMNPRENSDGKEINITLRTKPFAEDKQSRDRQQLVREVESQIEPIDEMAGPIEGETFEQFYDRLITSGRSPATAQFVAADWFNMPQDPKLQAWLTDERAIRFRVLNTSHSAYEAAIPTEYESLKHYVMEAYPEFCAKIVFRTAN